MQSREERIAEIKSIIRVNDEFEIPGTKRHSRRCGVITKINRTMFQYYRLYESGKVLVSKEYIDALHGTGSRITHDGVNIIQLP